jgi:RNA polymerase sigma-70 factor, ECF subfamily
MSVTVDLRLMASRVAAGDAAAYRPIVEHTQARLFRLAARMMGDLGDAEDALQEAYLKAYRAMAAGRYDGRAAVTTWLTRIVANACIDALRRRNEGPQEPKHEPRFDGGATADARLALRELESRMAALPPTQRAVLILRTVEGMSTEEVAKVLEISESAVMQRLVRARATLRGERDESESSDHEES